MNLRSVLCPIDYSEPSRAALRWAAALAARHRIRLTVMTAVDELLSEAARTRLGLDLAHSEYEPALRDFVATVIPEGAAWAPPMTLEVRVGRAADLILDAAQRHEADLIVLGTHGLGGLRKLILGSTAERVLRRTDRPVLAVPPGGTAAVAYDANGPRIDLGRIVAATDFSPASVDAVRWAADLAKEFAVPLLLVHVVEPLTIPAEIRSFVDPDETRIEGARHDLRELADRFCADISCEVIAVSGVAADTIAAVAARRGARLIVAGLASEQGPLAPRPGSIAYRVLTLAETPVLVVAPRRQPAS